MMIRQANQNDLNKIAEMIRAVVKKMQEQGSEQWDDSYPAKADYLRDINRDELFVYEVGQEIAGVCSISKRGHAEYGEINWSTNDPAWTLKRIAIHPNNHGQGIADELLKYAEKLAKKSGVYHLNTDTYSDNKYAQKLFLRHGFQIAEAKRIRDDGSELDYYEKSLEEKR